jgi:hypothetical protein
MSGNQLSADDRGGLDHGVADEYASFSHPWTHSIFTDSLTSLQLLMFEGEQQVGHERVIQNIMDEAHLLNLTIKVLSRGRGLGLKLLEYLMQRAQLEEGQDCFLECGLVTKWLTACMSASACGSRPAARLLPGCGDRRCPGDEDARCSVR